MPYTVRSKLEKITPGSQIDTWGDTQNRALDRLDESLMGAIGFSINGDRGLIYSNSDSDESHYAALHITGGTGGRLLMQPMQATYIVRNGSTGNVLVTVDGIQGALIQPGVVTQVFNDGTGKVWQIGPAGGDLKGYIDTLIAAERAYAESLVFDTVSGELPGQLGNEGKFLQTNGTNGSWQQPQITDVENLENQLNDIRSLAFNSRHFF